MRGSAALSFEREKLIDVSITELLIDAACSRIYLLSHNLRPNPRGALRMERVDDAEDDEHESEDW